MDSAEIDTIFSKSIYLLDKKTDILVTGQEILDQVVSSRLSGDTIITLKSDAFYLLTEKDSIIWTGKKIAETLPQAEYHNLMGWGAFFLGMVIGWNLYFINRYRKKDSIGLSDLATILTALGGAVLINFLDNSPRMIGLYGIGLGVGFFMYLLFLIYLSRRSATPDFMFPDFFLKVHDNQQPSLKLNSKHDENPPHSN